MRKTTTAMENINKKGKKKKCKKEKKPIYSRK